MGENYNELVVKLKDDISIIQEEINLKKKENLKNYCIKNLKISKTILNYCMPVIIASLAVPTIGYFCGLGLPFRKEIIKKERDEKSLSIDYQNNNNVIIVHNWIPKDEEIYEKVSTYYTIDNNKISKQDLNDILNGKINVDDILGKPIKVVKKEESNITSKDTYIQAFIVDENGKNIILEKEQQVVMKMFF